ncbi:MAG: hypothetical protein ACOH1O_01715 [Flavobacterium sp.]
MALIKVKDLEGDAEEIKDLLIHFGCDLNTYINTQPITKKIPEFWIYILVPVFFMLNCLLWIGVFDSIWSKVVTLLLFLILGVSSLIVQFNHKNWPITGIAFITGFCLILIGLNVYTPIEITKKIEEETIKRIPNNND